MTQQQERSHKYLIRTFLRERLEEFLQNGASMFSREEIEAELKRRDEFVRLRIEREGMQQENQ